MKNKPLINFRSEKGTLYICIDNEKKNKINKIYELKHYFSIIFLECEKTKFKYLSIRSKQKNQKHQ